MISLALAGAVSAWDVSTPAPRLHCGVETRVWCLVAGGNSLEMSEGQGARVWTIASREVSERIVVIESLNCDFVRPDGALDATKLSETRERVGSQLRTEISYEVPGYGCKVHISWHSALDDLTRWQGQFRRRVLSIIWLGVHEKKPLMRLIEP